MSSFAVRFVVLVFSGALIGLLAGLLLQALDVIENPFVAVAPGIFVAVGFLIYQQLGPEINRKR